MLHCAAHSGMLLVLVPAGAGRPTQRPPAARLPAMQPPASRTYGQPTAATHPFCRMSGASTALNASLPASVLACSMHRPASAAPHHPRPPHSPPCTRSPHHPTPCRPRTAARPPGTAPARPSTRPAAPHQHLDALCARLPHGVVRLFGVQAIDRLQHAPQHRPVCQDMLQSAVRLRAGADAASRKGWDGGGAGSRQRAARRAAPVGGRGRRAQRLTSAARQQLRMALLQPCLRIELPDCSCAASACTHMRV
jgi:hypothetical protein